MLALLDGAVFVAHNVRFDLAMLQHGLAAFGCAYEPPAVACTLEAFRLLEPLAPAAHQRHLRFADGPDEVHWMVVGRHELSMA